MIEKDKILFLQDFSMQRKGGGVSILKRIIQYSSDYGYDTQIAFDKSSNKGHDPAKLHEKSFFTLPRNFRFGIGRIIGSITIVCLDVLAIVSLLRLIKKEKPSVIHLTAHDVCYPVTALAARLSKIPVVVSIHDLWHLTVRAYIPEFLAHIIFKRTIKNVKTFYVISSYMSEYLTVKYGIKNYQVVHDGIKDNIQIPQDKQKYSSVPSFLYVGILHDMQVEMFKSFTKALSTFGQLAFNIGICSNTIYSSKITYNNVEINNYGWVSEDELKRISTRYTYGLLPLSFDVKDALFYRTSLMTKIPFYVQSALPVLCIGPSNSSAVRLINSQKLGASITTNNEKDLLHFLNEILQNHQNMYKKYLSNLEQAARTTFNMHVIAARFYNNLPDTSL